MSSEVTPGIKTTAAFNKAFQALNPQQKRAVEVIDGPVLVVAGPGTGKTQILTLRIGNILSRTDTQPSNILCLTYTDAGAVAMRSRLLQFIGPESYKVQIHTFHSFCNQVIQGNQEYFSEYTALQHISDLEKAQMLNNLIDQFPYENPLRRLKGNLYFEAKRLEELFSLMKRESWSPEYMLAKIDEELVKIESNPDHFYKKTGKTYVTGDPNPKYFRKKNQMNLLQAAVNAFTPFQEMMKRAGRYDFDDMIHWVRKAFESDEAFKADHQERFHYLLVDEYQDTNGSQNQIIQLLSDFWDRPNLFVVGDDDQAIFRFQGANISNLIELYEKYDPEVVVLTDNYRSTQKILNAAEAVIRNNNQRLEEQIPGVEKKLVAKAYNTNEGVNPEVGTYLSVIQEETGLFGRLKALLNQGVNPKEIAVLYRKHSQASNLIKALSQENVPVDVKQRVNILYEPIVLNIEKIMIYLLSEYERPGQDETVLFEIMHYRFFDLDPVDIAKVSMFCWKDRSHRRSLRQVIQDLDVLVSLELTNMDAFVAFNEILEYLVSQIPHVTLQVLLEKILKRGNVYREIMKSDQSVFLVQVVGTFFNHIKTECRRQPELNLKTLLEILSQMREMSISLPMHNLMRSREGINFMTAHGAKGLEFEHVFIIGCTNNNWEKIRGSYGQYRLPSTVNNPTADSDDEDERRLFYVGMTRAKKYLTFSYAGEKLNGMLNEPSQFLAEMMSGTDIPSMEKVVLEQQTVGYYSHLLNPGDRKLPLIDVALIDKVLERFVMTPTALNKYLQCPRTFYFEQILRVPLANSPYLGFGNAVHNSLQKLIEGFQQGQAMTKERLVELYEREMEVVQANFTEKQYENYLQHGSVILPMYLDEKRDLWSGAISLDAEKSVTHVTHRGVPVKGRLDLILKQPDERIRIVDFKTGMYRASKLKTPELHEELGGDYWRQVVFYKILLDEDPDPKRRMDIAEMSFIEPDDQGAFKKKEFIVDFGQVEKVSDQIVDSYRRMKNHEFDVDCGEEKCTWCSFVRNDFVLPDDTFSREDKSEEGLIEFIPTQMEMDF